MQEFGDLLMAGKDLITEDESRWPPGKISNSKQCAFLTKIGLFGLPKRHGKLKDIKKFDAQFFGVTPKQVQFWEN